MFVSALENVRPTSVAVARRAYDALEFLRIADAHLSSALDAMDDGFDWDQFAADSFGITTDNVYEARAGIRLGIALLQEATAGPPSLPESAFQAVRAHANSHPDNPPGLEGAALAIALASRTLVDAVYDPANAKEYTDFDDFLLGVREIIKEEIFAEAVSGFSTECAARRVMRGEPIEKRRKAPVVA